MHDTTNAEAVTRAEAEERAVAYFTEAFKLERILFGMSITALRERARRAGVDAETVDKRLGRGAFARRPLVWAVIHKEMPMPKEA